MEHTLTREERFNNWSENGAGGAAFNRNSKTWRRIISSHGAEMTNSPENVTTQASAKPEGFTLG